MNIAVLGGTGKLGLAFAARAHHTGHDVVIGSRDAAKADEAAKKIGAGIRGMTNAAAAAWAAVAFVSVPYAAHRALLESLRVQLGGKIVIDATVSLDPMNLLQIKTESGRSAAEEASEILEGVQVFAAF